MKKIDLGQTIQILANVGVIAGIVFLGIEIRQNNDLLEYQKRRDSLELSQTMTDTLLQDANLRDSVGRALAGQELTVGEMASLNLFRQKVLSTMEWQYLEVPESRAGIRRSILSSPSIFSGEPWQVYRVRANAAFASFVDAVLEEQ